jgi:predicted AAA+ superfamily ATPase
MASSNEGKAFGELLIELHKTLSLKGIKDTIKHLRSTRELEIMDNKVKNIIDAVIIAFGNKDFLLKKQDDVNMSARALLAHVLKKNGFSVSYIGDVLKISRPSVYKLLRHFEDANLVNPKAPIDIILKEAYEKLEIKQ